MSLQAVIHFSVVDESPDWIVVDKPAPLIVHPANSHPEPTLLGGLENLLSYDIQNGARLGIVTRLDRDTSGLVLVAKHTAAARELGGVFEQRLAEKTYLAIVKGWPTADSWECSSPIIRAGELAPTAIWVRQMVHPAGRDCSTAFHVEKRIERDEGKFALVRCVPATGRMHQIRVHLAATGFPIVGDKIYSGDGAEYLEWMETGWTLDLKRKLMLQRHALHSSQLKLRWRGTDLSWQAPLPAQFSSFLQGDPVEDLTDVVIWSRYD